MSIVEIIRFQPAEGAEERLLAQREAAVSALTERFGLTDSILTASQDDSTWVDIMVFPSADHADEALEAEMSLPDFARWVANVDHVVERQRFDVKGI